MTPDQLREMNTLKMQLVELQQQVKALSDSTSIPINMVEALKREGFIKVVGPKIITYTNPSGRDFYSNFVEYNQETNTLALGGPGYYMPIENVAPATDIFTITNHGVSDTQQVTMATTGTLPGGLSLQLIYYVRDATTDTFKLALSSGGTAINITSVGEGRHYINQV